LIARVVPLQEIDVMKTLLVAATAALALSGCIVLPAGPRYHHADPGPAVIVPPPVVVRPWHRHRDYAPYPYYRRNWGEP